VFVINDSKWAGFVVDDDWRGGIVGDALERSCLVMHTGPATPLLAVFGTYTTFTSIETSLLHDYRTLRLLLSYSTMPPRKKKTVTFDLPEGVLNTITLGQSAGDDELEDDNDLDTVDRDDLSHEINVAAEHQDELKRVKQESVFTKEELQSLETTMKQSHAQSTIRAYEGCVSNDCVW